MFQLEASGFRKFHYLFYIVVSNLKKKLYRKIHYSASSLPILFDSFRQKYREILLREKLGRGRQSFPGASCSWQRQRFVNLIVSPYLRLHVGRWWTTGRRCRRQHGTGRQSTVHHRPSSMKDRGGVLSHWRLCRCGSSSVTRWSWSSSCSPPSSSSSSWRVARWAVAASTTCQHAWIPMLTDYNSASVIVLGSWSWSCKNSLRYNAACLSIHRL